MQVKKSLKKFLRIIKRFFLFTLSIGIIFSVLFFMDAFFRVTEIEVKGLPQNMTIKGMGIYNNKNLFFLSAQDIGEKIQRENPYVKEVVVKRIFPHTLQISLAFTSPIAVFNGGSGYFYLSSEGRILYKKREMDEPFPMIRYYQKIDYYSKNAGDTISFKDVLCSLFFLKASQDMGLKIDSIDIEGLHMIVLHLRGKNIFFTTEKDQEQQAYELEKIIHRFKIEGKEFKSIDLRFDRPIVVLSS